MKRIIYLVSLLFIATIFFSCASGTTLITGKQRTPTTADKVVIYTDFPKNYEVIGLVSASSDAGLSEQGDLDYAMTELKRQSAKIGANGIVLQKISTSRWVGISAKDISGTAIYVSE